MKFKYIGDPNRPGESKDLPETFNAFGVTFPRNKYAEVPDDVASKLATNQHFKAEKPGEVEDLTDDKPSEETQAAIANIQAEAYQNGYAAAEAAAKDQIQRMQADHEEALAAERDRADAAEQLLAETHLSGTADSEGNFVADEQQQAAPKRGPGRPKGS